MGGEQFDTWVAKGNYWEYYLQPITKTHLTSDLNGEFEANGNETYVYVFSVVGFIIFIIACINFMNLSTAKSSIRAKEVGMRWASLFKLTLFMPQIMNRIGKIFSGCGNIDGELNRYLLGKKH